MDFPYTIEQSAKNKDPSILAAYAHQLASEFSAWYRDNPVLKNDNPDISASRLALVTAIKRNTPKSKQFVMHTISRRHVRRPGY